LWFAIGTNLNALGRHGNAAQAYDTARVLGRHYRMPWYQFGPYQSYYEAGRYNDVVASATTTLATAENLEDPLLWRGHARLALGDTPRARADYLPAPFSTPTGNQRLKHSPHLTRRTRRMVSLGRDLVYTSVYAIYGATYVRNRSSYARTRRRRRPGR